jgi:hypothetical protein
MTFKPCIIFNIGMPNQGDITYPNTLIMHVSFEKLLLIESQYS